MRYTTRQLGVIELARDKVLCFVAPMLGFESHRKYALLPAPGARPFFWLQSLETPQLAFPMVNAEELGMAYPVSSDNLRAVAAASADEVACWVVVALPAGGDGKPRLNLHAPVLVNARKQLAAQIVVGDEALIARTEPLHQKRSAPCPRKTVAERELLVGSARS